MKRKRPRDTNQLAKMIVDLSVGATTEPDPVKAVKGRAAARTPQKRRRKPTR